MPPVTSIAKPQAKLITQCPYCDHVSPVGSKFCGECGAALHLLPCPHCGAVNDITVATACYRCHRELREKAAAAPAIMAPPPTAISPYAVAAPRQRPYALVIGIIFLALAAASYYVYRQRAAPDGHASGSDAGEMKANPPSAESNANSGAGTIVKIPMEAPKNAAPTASAPPVPVEVRNARPETESVRAATTAARPASGKPATTVETVPAAAIVTPDSTRARIDATKGLEKQAPYTGPCTDAVAALGLCAVEPTPRRQ